MSILIYKHLCFAFNIVFNGRSLSSVLAITDYTNNISVRMLAVPFLSRTIATLNVFCPDKNVCVHIEPYTKVNISLIGNGKEYFSYQFSSDLFSTGI